MRRAGWETDLEAENSNRVVLTQVLISCQCFLPTFKDKVYFLVINHINISLSRDVSKILGQLIIKTLSRLKGRCFLKVISLTKTDFDHPPLQMQYKGIQKSPVFILTGSPNQNTSSKVVRLSFYKSEILFYNLFLPVSHPQGAFRNV